VTTAAKCQARGVRSHPETKNFPQGVVGFSDQFRFSFVKDTKNEKQNVQNTAPFGAYNNKWYAEQQSIEAVFRASRAQGGASRDPDVYRFARFGVDFLYVYRKGEGHRLARWS
jgi:hypothetical protein